VAKNLTPFNRPLSKLIMAHLRVSKFIMAHLRDYFLNWFLHCPRGNIVLILVQRTMKKPIGKELESESLAVSKEVNASRFRDTL
jgi:hypothetical protein